VNQKAVDLRAEPDFFFRQSFLFDVSVHEKNQPIEGEGGPSIGLHFDKNSAAQFKILTFLALLM
jgi:hypothetical protein